MIGIFDSGIGGISVLQEIRRLLPTIDWVYLGDTAHVPYGEKSSAEIQSYALAATNRLASLHPAAIVVACNTATAVAITSLRLAHPDIPIIGVVPVVKTLAERTKAKRVAVCATAATLQSEVYVKLKQDFAAGIEFLELPKPEWVRFVEAGKLDSNEVHSSVSETLKEIKEFGADVLALGSTHFPWLRPVIDPLADPIHVLDSGPAVARHLARVLEHNHTLSMDERGQGTWLASGDPKEFSDIASRLLRESIQADSV